MSAGLLCLQPSMSHIENDGNSFFQTYLNYHSKRKLSTLVQEDEFPESPSKSSSPIGSVLGAKRHCSSSSNTNSKTNIDFGHTNSIKVRKRHESPFVLPTDQSIVIAKCCKRQENTTVSERQILRTQLRGESQETNSLSRLSVHQMQEFIRERVTIHQSHNCMSDMAVLSRDIVDEFTTSRHNELQDQIVSIVSHHQMSCDRINQDRLNTSMTQLGLNGRFNSPIQAGRPSMVDVYS